LKLSRLVPRRSLAQKMCEGGAVAINGTRAKSSHTVRLGDEIKIRGRERTLTVKVADIPPKPPPKSLAANMYGMISEELHSTDDFDQT
jgi:ribosomal 50S subunit-recycling heat shock protein